MRAAAASARRRRRGRRRSTAGRGPARGTRAPSERTAQRRHRQHGRLRCDALFPRRTARSSICTARSSASTQQDLRVEHRRARCSTSSRRRPTSRSAAEVLDDLRNAHGVPADGGALPRRRAICCASARRPLTRAADVTPEHTRAAGAARRPAERAGRAVATAPVARATRRTCRPARSWRICSTSFARGARDGVSMARQASERRSSRPVLDERGRPARRDEHHRAGSADPFARSRRVVRGDSTRRVG